MLPIDTLLLNYCGKFLPSLCKALANLYKLLLSVTYWRWTATEQEAWQKACQTRGDEDVDALSPYSLNVMQFVQQGWPAFLEEQGEELKLYYRTNVWSSPHTVATVEMQSCHSSFWSWMGSAWTSPGPSWSYMNEGSCTNVYLVAEHWHLVKSSPCTVTECAAFPPSSPLQLIQWSWPTLSLGYEYMWTWPGQTCLITLLAPTQQALQKKYRDQ